MIADYKSYKIHCFDDRFVKEVLINEEYRFSKEGKTIIDIGANVGTYSIYAYDNAEIIYAIEPSEIEYGYLVRNVEVNNLGKIKTFNIALGKENGRQNLYIAHGNGSGSFYDEGNGAFQPESVEVKTLATFMLENNIEYVDLMKVDVEKAETDIFSADDFKEVSNKIAFIFGEKHGNDNQLEDILSKHNFDVQFIANHFIARKVWGVE